MLTQQQQLEHTSSCCADFWTKPFFIEEININLGYLCEPWTPEILWFEQARGVSPSSYRHPYFQLLIPGRGVAFHWLNTLPKQKAVSGDLGQIFGCWFIYRQRFKSIKEFPNTSPTIADYISRYLDQISTLDSWMVYCFPTPFWIVRYELVRKGSVSILVYMSFKMYLPKVWRKHLNGAL